MHRGFNLKPNSTTSLFDSNYNSGLQIYSDIEKITKPALDKYISPDGSIDASKMEEDWFPQNIINPNVFISHSRQDKDKAIALAGWLYDNFGLTSFIDSCIWNYADDLLDAIDRKYCWTDEEKLTFNYNKRNYSTSHVHMMLSAALCKMMDKTECLIFMNTINSISAKGLIEETESPWIYAEITMSQLIQFRPTGREPEAKQEREIKLMSEKQLFENFPSFKYKAGTSHLTEIDESRLANWYFTRSEDKHHLDTLYDQNPKKKT